MKRNLLSLLLVLTLLLGLLSGCDVQLDLNKDDPKIHVNMSDEISDILGSGELNVEIGKDGPKFNIDLHSQHSEDILKSCPGLDSIPPYEGNPYIAVNDNQPYFSEEEITDKSFEFYSDLDSLKRCGVTMASIGQDLMPTEKRESIQNVRPTGWHSVQYDWVDGKSLYNRCHLIGFQLAGENANERNLITGTR